MKDTSLYQGIQVIWKHSGMGFLKVIPLVGVIGRSGRRGGNYSSVKERRLYKNEERERVYLEGDRGGGRLGDYEKGQFVFSLSSLPAQFGHRWSSLEITTH